MNERLEERSGVILLATAPRICGWKIKAVIPAMNAAMKSVTIAETFFTMSIAVNTGTSSSHGDMLNVFLRSAEKSAASAAAGC